MIRPLPQRCASARVAAPMGRSRVMRAVCLLGAAAMLAAMDPAPVAGQEAAPIVHLRWAQRYVRAGENAWVTYTAIRAATVSFSIVDAGGHEIRDLGDDVAVEPGLHGVEWDGFSDQVRPVPEGSYQLVLRAVDDSGQATLASATLTRDYRPPGVVFLTRALTSSTSLVVRLSDNLSGIGRAKLIYRDRTVASVGGGATQLVYRPPHGWAPGPRTISVLAFDKAGNATRATRVFDVRPHRRR